MNDTTKQAAPLLAPPYRVIAGRGIADVRGRLVASIEARMALDARGYARESREDSNMQAIPPGLSPTDADALAHELVRVLNSHTRIVDALRDLLDWGRSNTGPLDANTPHQLLVEAAGALDGEAPTLDGYTALMDARYLLTDIRDFWAGGDCPPELWARIEAATGAPQRAADAVLKAGMEDDGNA